MNKLLLIFFLIISLTVFSQENSDEIMPVRITDLQRSQIELTAVNQIMPEFNMLDSVLNKIESSSFKGTILVIDIWATWCAPCLKEVPYFKKLKESYENDTLKFISVSIDTYSEEWLEYLNIKKHSKQDHYFAGYNENHPIIWLTSTKDQAKGIESLVRSIPSIVVIDKNQKIIYRNASLPSSGRLMEEIKNIN